MLLPEEGVTAFVLLAKPNITTGLLCLILPTCRAASAAHGLHCEHLSQVHSTQLILYSWMTGPNWPNSGEIDIIEGVNTQSQNQMTMHTSAGCTLAGSDCQGNTGCPVTGGGSSSYGNGFNSANGGTYAMEWTSAQISIWFFSRGSEPGDINSANPNPSNWGNPTGSFAGGSGCDIDSHFMNNNIVFDTTFCGDWAGKVWSSDGTCSALASTCQDYVQNNPSAFQDAYWAINSLKVYTSDGSVSEITSVTAASVQSPVSIAQPTLSPTAPFSVLSSTASASPLPSDNATVISQSTASAVPILSSNSSAPGRANVNPTPTNVSPAEASGTVATSTFTETSQPSIDFGFHHRRPPSFGPKSKRISRVARHLQQHAHGTHGHS